MKIAKMGRRTLSVNLLVLLLALYGLNVCKTAGTESGITRADMILLDMYELLCESPSLPRDLMFGNGNYFYFSSVS